MWKRNNTEWFANASQPVGLIAKFIDPHSGWSIKGL